MKWFLVLLIIPFLGCGELPQEIPEVEIPLEENEVAFPAPLPSNIRVRVKQHPERAEGACKKVCEQAGGRMHKLGPANNPVGWECLCSKEG